MDAVINEWTNVVTDQDTFLKELGAKLCGLRKERGLTQGQLGSLVDVTQQVIAEYEAGYRNIPIYRLVSLAEALNVQVETLLSDTSLKKKKPGPVSNIQRQLEQIRQLPKSEQQFVSKFIENVLAKSHS